MESAVPATEAGSFRRILGIRFFGGTVQQAIERMRRGGLLVVPAAPALKDLGTDSAYREALLNADLAITDSAFMVLIWNFLERDHLPRMSGLEYLRDLLEDEEIKQPGATLWVMASPKSARTNLEWLEQHGFSIPESSIYMAPMYGRVMDDPALVEQIERTRPAHIIVTLGGGTQERLGLFLKRNLTYLPGIHCIGAAIAFLSGDQVHIPVWADKLYLGWLYRCISEPQRYVPRYWEARRLVALMYRYRSELPPLVDQAAS